MAMTLRLPAELDAKLRETAEREGRSLHETVLVAIDEYVTKRDRKRDALIARIMEEDKDVLDRLGSA
jgi:predicted transcriptional regulator